MTSFERKVLKGNMNNLAYILYVEYNKYKEYENSENSKGQNDFFRIKLQRQKYVQDSLDKGFNVDNELNKHLVSLNFTPERLLSELKTHQYFLFQQN